MSIVFPSKNSWITPRSSTTRLTTENCQIITNSKIEHIDKVMLSAKDIYVSAFVGSGVQYNLALSEFSLTNNSSGSITELDITKYIVEKSKYDTLSIDKRNQFSYGEPHLQNSSYYTRDTNVIDIVSSFMKGEWDLFNTSVFSSLIQAALYDLAKDGLWYYWNGKYIFLDQYKFKEPNQSNNNPMFAQFRVYYTPSGESVKLKSVKVNPQPQQFTIPFSQQQPIVNNTTMGKEMQSIANRTGCEQKEVVRIIPDIKFYREPGTIWKEKDNNGNFTGNVWRLTRCELSIYSDTYIKVVETWSKNWTYRSPNVPINREFRSWDIPADIVQRNLHYNDYCIFSRKYLSSVLPDNALISGDARKTIVRKLQSQTDIQNEMSNMWFMRESSVGSNNFNIGAVLSCSAFGFGNSIVFSGKTKDNLSAGVQRVKADDQDNDYQFCKDVYYCNEDGTLENIVIQVANGIIDSNGDPMAYPQFSITTQGQVVILQNAPQGKLLFRTTGTKTNKLHIQKDPSEQLNFTYQLHFMTDDGFLVLGTAWTANNELVKTPNTPNKIKVWGLSQAIPAGLPVMSTQYGEVVANTTLFQAYTAGSEDNLHISLSFTPQNHVGVCVTDDNNNVLVAYNNSEAATYYGTFTHNYEDIYDVLFDTNN